MQEVWKVVILAIVQGVTEFLPISSDGHLVVASLILGVQIEQDPQLHDLFVVLHFGTLLSILVIYFDRLIKLLGEHRRLLGPIFVASIPAGVFGIAIKKGLPESLEHWLLLDPLVTSIGFFTTSAALLIGGYARRGERDYVDIKWPSALTIGFAQALAILPGVSRSGLTISTGLKLGLSPRSAASFSFLLGVPVIAGATVLELVELLRASPEVTSGVETASRMSPVSLAIGVVVSFIVGVVSLKLLLGILERGKFQWFAFWCLPMGLGLLIYVLFLQGA